MVDFKPVLPLPTMFRRCSQSLFNGLYLRLSCMNSFMYYLFQSIVYIASNTFPFFPPAGLGGNWVLTPSKSSLFHITFAPWFPASPRLTIITSIFTVLNFFLLMNFLPLPSPTSTPRLCVHYTHPAFLSASTNPFFIASSHLLLLTLCHILFSPYTGFPSVSCLVLHNLAFHHILPWMAY